MECIMYESVTIYTCDCEIRTINRYVIILNINNKMSELTNYL